MTIDHLTHRFITSVPDELEPGLLYVSIEYDTTIHLCACGCGNKVVLPLHPTAWRFTYDGTTVSMSPSVGNWSFPCRSHYCIERGRIRWSRAWTNAQVTAARQRTLRERGVHSPPAAETRVPTALGLWRYLLDVVRRMLNCP